MCSDGNLRVWTLEAGGVKMVANHSFWRADLARAGNDQGAGASSNVLRAGLLRLVVPNAPTPAGLADHVVLLLHFNGAFLVLGTSFGVAAPGAGSAAGKASSAVSFREIAYVYICASFAVALVMVHMVKWFTSRALIDMSQVHTGLHAFLRSTSRCTRGRVPSLRRLRYLDHVAARSQIRRPVFRDAARRRRGRGRSAAAPWRYSATANVVLASSISRHRSSTQRRRAMGSRVRQHGDPRV